MLRDRLMRSAAVFAQPGGSAEGSPPPAGEETPPAKETPPAGEETPPAESETLPVGEETPPAESETLPAASEDWRDKEIRRKHAQNQELKRQMVERESELEALRAVAERTQGGDRPAGEEASPAARAAPTIPQDAVKAAAQQLRAQERFDDDANAADKSGRERYKDGWSKATETLKTLGGFDPESMQQILATDDPAQVLYELGSKPENYQRVMDLPPYKRFAELVKLATPTPKPAPKRPSGAEPPVEPIGGRNRGDPTELRDDLTDEEWYARRSRQRTARQQAKAGR